MKLIKKIKTNTTYIVLLVVATFFLGCSNYLDVDKDTDSATAVPLSFLLTGVEKSVGDEIDFNNNSGQILAVFMHQATARADEDQYGTKASDVNLENDWTNLYTALTSIETLSNQAKESGNLVYLGLAQIQKAYLMSVAVDLWGDVPYTEATQLVNGISTPKFDNQKDVYKAVFALIETAKTNIASNAGLNKPGVDDLFYNGDTAKWIKFANTLKLKLYNQTRLTADFDTAGFNALITENKFMTSIADDFQFKHYNATAPSNERNALYIDSYESTQFGSYVSPWFYEIMQGINPKIHTGIVDPRIKFYFYNQLSPNQFPPDQGDANTGNPGADYWNKLTGFFSIRFGSVGPDRDKSAENSYTYPGIFPCGGRYNDGLGKLTATGRAKSNTGTGKAPHRILTYDEYLYTKAELTLVGKLPGGTAGAGVLLQSAVKASLAKVDQVVAQNDAGTAKPAPLVAIPTLAGSIVATTFLTKLDTEYNAASNTKKLEIIMTQKWVGTYGDCFDQYNDYRRTGYPVLANPTGASPEYQLNNLDLFPLNDSQTIQNNQFQQSYFWPLKEISSNKNAPVQKSPPTYKIFWAN